MEVGGVIRLAKQTPPTPGHQYFTRSRSSLCSADDLKDKDTKHDIKGKRLGKDAKSDPNMLTNNNLTHAKESRKRSHGDLPRCSASPNNPPTKSCRNANSNMSFMDTNSASTSRVRFSNSTSSLSNGEFISTIKKNVILKPPSFPAKQSYDLCKSASGISDISFTFVSPSPPWNTDSAGKSLSDEDLQWFSFRQEMQRNDHNEIFKFDQDGEGSAEWSSTVIHSLSDVNVPDVKRSNVLLNYNPDGSIDLLGEGEYGYVVRGILKGTGYDQDIVAKYFKKDRSSIEDILDEARIQLYLYETGYVPRIHGLIESNRMDCDPILVQECFGNGVTLDDLLEQKVSKKVWLELCLQVATGLLKIHQKGVLVNDIKLDNILVDYKGKSQQIRFIDMGIATFRSSYVSGGSEAAMAECSHLAPEVRKLKPSSAKSDIYGLGFVLKTIGQEADIQELLTLGNKLMAEKPNHRYSLATTINRLHSLLRNL